MEFWLSTSPWYGVILWIILYISDYSLTISSARGFREIGHFKFEGSFELTPQFQKDVDALKPVSRRHIILLVLVSFLILLLWLLTKRVLFFPWTYLLFLGLFLFMEVAIHFRHLRNLFLIGEVRKNGGVEGQIFYRKWFSYRMSAFEFYLFSALFLIIAVLNYSPFFLGGAMACFAVGANHNKLAKKTRAMPSPIVEPPG
ncbi:MAG: hypothetical protein EHM40_23540 [Chloroflexi bacterium]|nr:MAG: hypothetical protein EHM40_23540 [Chloroflexota bacterium]